MLLPLTTIIPIDGRESSGALVSTASSRTMFMNWSYPRRTPSTPRLPFSCSDNFLSINLFISGKYLLILKLLQKITTEYFKKTKVKDPKALLFPLPKLQRIPNNW
uniref:Uncharacterized protein n=1 Tax=Rhodosorus marinus TaxID=101924 RepID=A0A7S2ZQB3_9RHOD